MKKSKKYLKIFKNIVLLGLLFFAIAFFFKLGVSRCFFDSNTAESVQKFRESKEWKAYSKTDEYKCYYKDAKDGGCEREYELRNFGGCPVTLSQWQISGKRWYEMDKQEFKEKMKELGFESMDEFWKWQKICNLELRVDWLLRNKVKGD